ncbi:hypothetical protein AXI76_gp135 [Pseudoalteromonas phage H101]|uniref:Uncharacterized protein n=1 Tax=Pseudoalteromonas phage H101 TaxID=1654919 RepID=A0A0H4IT28_9CAUD|nr:hypothetical protein AXI76_gp135 [Pseudoalteromonas phage H101]AKO61036.1 hypothetical protein [Pseudoalteromonas phage H101]|tara:strand:- start:277 stop:495 length:219 start_codon:yes stop_codon:yes gene_type:complete
MYVITQENKLVEIKGSFEEQLKTLNIKAVLLTNPQDPLNRFSNQILSWCGQKRPKDDYESILQSAQALQHEQ